MDAQIADELGILQTRAGPDGKEPHNMAPQTPRLRSHVISAIVPGHTARRGAGLPANPQASGGSLRAPLLTFKRTLVLLGPGLNEASDLATMLPKARRITHSDQGGIRVTRPTPRDSRTTPTRHA